MKIVWTKLAIKDLGRAWDYVALDKPSMADALMEVIARAAESLRAYPNLGRPGRVRGTRELVVVGTPFIIPYRVRSDRIEILAVLHGARRWPDAL